MEEYRRLRQYLLRKPTLGGCRVERVPGGYRVVCRRGNAVVSEEGAVFLFEDNRMAFYKGDVSVEGRDLRYPARPFSEALASIGFQEEAESPEELYGMAESVYTAWEEDIEEVKRRLRERYGEVYE
ncbi:hypothetical protein [Thermofilum pendens]|nr:hypothetical protein [Thermofilum pendens]